MPTKVLFGAGQLQNLHKEVLPGKKALVEGMDAFFHAAETVINRNVHPMAGMFALKMSSYGITEEEVQTWPEPVEGSR